MAERAVTSTRRCTVNPLIGRELDGTEVLPAANRKSPGGGRRTRRAEGGADGRTERSRSHSVREGRPDRRHSKREEAIPFKHEMYELGVTLEKLARDAGVEIRLNTEVTRKYVDRENVDALIIAVGSAPLIPPVEGLDGSQVVVVNDYYLKQDQVEDEVVVLRRRTGRM